ncbi:hypothetical protein ULMS_07130 [Patiriisocius marinistellae]|uniref:Uncharacterized protein n=1 Tax=Patiriisocius marinistellae TaxID=2494560 RepID=A0A5J4FYW6_9FLAO|nr:hypothetical protein ULMS_07130 [Patiriisocius marinistellae]
MLLSSFTSQIFCQERINPPKKNSKIKSADQFVDNTFQLYHKIYVYDSLSQKGVEIPPELEDELLANAQKDIDSLWQVLPTVVEDMGSGKGNIMRKGKATLNLNKAKKALRYCLATSKTYFIGTDEEE